MASIAAEGCQCYSAFGFPGDSSEKETHKFWNKGTVPDDGEQALPSGPEKPKVVKWSPTLNNMSFCSAAALRPFFRSGPHVERRGVFFGLRVAGGASAGAGPVPGPMRLVSEWSWDRWRSFVARPFPRERVRVLQ